MAAGIVSRKVGGDNERGVSASLCEGMGIDP